MLGGKPQTSTERKSSRTNNKNNNNVKWRISSTELDAGLDFAEESQRFICKEDTTA